MLPLAETKLSYKVAQGMHKHFRLAHLSHRMYDCRAVVCLIHYGRKILFVGAAVRYSSDHRCPHLYTSAVLTTSCMQSTRMHFSTSFHVLVSIVLTTCHLHSMPVHSYGASLPTVNSSVVAGLASGVQSLHQSVICYLGCEGLG